MFIKFDTDFDEIASEPSCRRSEIVRLTEQRKALFWVAMLVTSAAVGSMFVNRGGTAVVTFFAAMLWMVAFKINADVRLLRVIDRVQTSQPVQGAK